MTMYVADITNNCILGLDYLKARKAVIDLSQRVLVVNGTIVKGKYKHAEGTPVRTLGLIKLDWLMTVIFFLIQ